MRPQEGKILLRALVLDKIPIKQIVFQTLQLELNVPLIALKPTKVGYLAFTEHQNQVDKLLTDKAKSKLGSIGLETRLPPRLKAERSVICRRVDSSVGEMSKEQIKEEINRCNRNIEAIEVTKFGTLTHLFKIEFKTIEHADNSLQTGILCFNVKISGHQMQKEKFTDILICFACYKLEEHSTENCPDKDTIVCSECTGNHNFKDCRSLTKKCLNCGGDHRTMAMACPKKKEIVRRKRREEEDKEKNKQEMTYARVAEKTIEKVNQNTKKTEDTQTMLDNLGLRSIIMIMDAHIHNIIEPGSYNKRLNQTLENNNIQQVKLEEPDSNKLLSHKIIGETIQTMCRREKLEKLERIGKQLEEEKEMSTDGHISDQESEEEEEQESDSEIAAYISGQCKEVTNYSMKIFALNTEVKKSPLSPKALTRNFKEGNIKYQVSDSSVSIQVVETLIKDQKLYAQLDNIKFIDPSEFKKVRNGYIKSPTKPHYQGKKAKQRSSHY